MLTTFDNQHCLRYSLVCFAQKHIEKVQSSFAWFPVEHGRSLFDVCRLGTENAQTSLQTEQHFKLFIQVGTVCIGSTGQWLCGHDAWLIRFNLVDGDGLPHILPLVVLDRVDHVGLVASGQRRSVHSTLGLSVAVESTWRDELVSVVDIVILDPLQWVIVTFGFVNFSSYKNRR